MRLFPIHFRDYVMPRLRAAVDVQSFFIVCGTREYGAASAEVFAIARKFGALHLPDQRLEELQEWIAIALLQGITAAERRVDEIEAKLEAADRAAAEKAPRKSRPRAARPTRGQAAAGHRFTAARLGLGK
jgi:hypothetical protein